ncbi:MAG: 4-alpha-glucanotransferase [Acidobacteriota bacterium]
MTRTYEQTLERAAALWGIEPEYEDVLHWKHRTSPETQKAILAALGVPTTTKEDLDGAIERRLREERSRPLPPVWVVTSGAGPREIPLHLPAELADGSVSIEFLWEGGGAERRELPAAALGAVPLPENLPLGYHEVRVSLPAGGEARTRLIVCPDRAWRPPSGERAAGLAISLYSLRSGRNWGCGDFTDLERLVDWLVEEAGVSFVGLNPLHAIFNRQPFNTSPYLPASVFYRNLIYLDVERVEDFQNSARARRFVSRPEVQAELETLRSGELVEYERVHRLKLGALKLAFAAFLREWRRDSARARQFREYAEREGNLLERFAVFCALDEWIRARNPGVWVWPDWPEQYRDPDSEAVRNFARKHWRSVLFYQWVQWQLDLQLAAAQEYARRKGLSIGLYHDLALATDRCGADFWAWRSFYVSGCRVGAPPDDFSPKGQDWAFPPPDCEHHRETGYRLFVESIRKNCRHGGALRIDHVMRFFRLYWIPEGRDPTQGAYVRQPHEELLPILALESVRQQVMVIGEDLGTVTPEIRAALDRYGLLGYKVPYFEKHADGRFRLPQDYPEQSLVSSTTHDLPTLAGFWLSRDIEARHAAGLIDAEDYERQLGTREGEKQKMLALLFELGLLPDWFPRNAHEVPELWSDLHNAFIGFLAGARSRLMVLTQEDLFKEAEQQNLPASTWQHPNWRRKMRFHLEELRSTRYTRDCTAMFRHWLERRGRACPTPTPLSG